MIIVHPLLSPHCSYCILISSQHQIQKSNSVIAFIFTRKEDPSIAFIISTSIFYIIRISFTNLTNNLGW